MRPVSSRHSSAGRRPVLLVHGAGLALAGLVLAAAGQPLFAEDTWLHLALGRAYAVSGPRLAEDPLLYTAPGPPAPSAWLAELALHAVQRAAGFQGLRVLHVLLVLSILAAAWGLLRRASGSRAFASAGTALFAVSAAYRLFQLRPHLLTLLATLGLVGLLLTGDRPPSWRRVALTTGLFALWANVHGAFVLGLGLLAAALAGCAARLAASRLGGPAQAPDAPARAVRLAAALGLGLLASLANPAGARQHLLYFAAGAGTPDLAVVSDEWAPLGLLQLPLPANLPPSPLTWAVVWALLAATPFAVFVHARARHRAEGGAAAPPLDPALLAATAAAFVAMASAVRLTWLGILPMLVIGRAWRAAKPFAAALRPGIAAAGALAAVLLVPAFLRLGAWPMISQGVHPAVYARPYPAAKWYAHAVWFLCDAELEGRLWNDYHDGNFLGYWLAPRMRTFVNGSLNVPPEVLRAGFAIRMRHGMRSGERFVDLLDRQGVDAFVGTGLPVAYGPGHRSMATTTSYLERTPGWISVFRSAESAVYLRKSERNRRNLERVAAYYARRGAPFDPDRGFDPERAIRMAPGWAVSNGLVPEHFERLEAAARSGGAQAREALASRYALLGLYERAVALDRRAAPGSVTAARRLVWSFLHLGRVAESRAAAARLARLAAPDDLLSRRLVNEARRFGDLSTEHAAARRARLPLFEPSEARALRAGVREPEPRRRCP